MVANTAPIYALTPQNGAAQAGAIIGTSANTATDGTGANMYLIFTAGSTDGSYVQKVILKPVSSIAATVARLWLLNDTGTFTANTTNTAAKTYMIAEVSILAFTASNTLASPVYEIPLNFAMAASTKLLMSFGTSTGAATTGFNPLTIAGNY
jgi:hypothetical protein